MDKPGPTVYVDKPGPTVYVDKPGPTVYVDKPGPTVYVDKPGPTVYVDKPGPTVYLSDLDHSSCVNREVVHNGIQWRRNKIWELAANRVPYANAFEANVFREIQQLADHHGWPTYENWT